MYEMLQKLEILQGWAQVRSASSEAAGICFAREAFAFLPVSHFITVSVPPAMITTRAIRRLQPWTARRSIQRRSNATYQPPEPPKGSNRHREFYKTFGRPLAKNFLIAVVTYQILYISWLKLESFEVKKEKNDEISSVEGELKNLTKGKSLS